jgi:uncharacterized membrane protein
MSPPRDHRLRRYFVAGLLVLVPLLVTLFIIEQLFLLIAGILAGPITFAFGGEEALRQALPLLGWTGLRIGHLVPLASTLALLLVILATGAVARNFLGARALAFGERMLVQIPVVRNIYTAARQISDALLSSQKNVFRRAVLFEYPRRGTWSVGFVTEDSDFDFTAEPGSISHLHVFLPTTPNPTSGYLLFVPRQECVELDMSIEDALKLIISGGSVTPETFRRSTTEDPGSRTGAAGTPSRE